MKTILMALSLSLFAYAGAQAQTCRSKTVARHKTVHHTMQNTVKEETTTAQSCRLLPYQACSINPDRKSVSCYQTTDLENLTPLNNNLTTYGPDGPIPGQIQQPAMKTIIIKGKDISNSCKRNQNGNATVCTYTGSRLYRDPFGNYFYR